MKFIVSCFLFFLAMITACSSFSTTGGSRAESEIGDQTLIPKDTPTYYGNIYGTIIDGSSKHPIGNAVIYVTEKSVRYLTGDDPAAVSSDQGPVVIPDPATAVCRGTSGPDGSFLINNIPVNGASRIYTVIITAPGRDTTVIDQVAVLPGASMALKINCRMTSDGRAHIIKIFKGHRDVDINYSDELKKPLERYFH